MRLRARGAHQVRVADLDLTVEFAAGEELRTEISAKFTPERVDERARRRRPRRSAGGGPTPPATSASPSPTRRDEPAGRGAGRGVAARPRRPRASCRSTPPGAPPRRVRVLDTTIAYLRREAAVGGYAAEAEVAPDARRAPRPPRRARRPPGADARRAGAQRDGRVHDAARPRGRCRPGRRVGTLPIRVREQPDGPRRARRAWDGWTLVDAHRRRRGAPRPRHAPAGAAPRDRPASPSRSSPASGAWSSPPPTAIVPSPAPPASRVAARRGPGRRPGARSTDCCADAYVGTARKWLRGPRGHGLAGGDGAGRGPLVPEYPSLIGLGRARRRATRQPARPPSRPRSAWPPPSTSVRRPTRPRCPTESPRSAPTARARLDGHRRLAGPGAPRRAVGDRDPRPPRPGPRRPSPERLLGRGDRHDGDPGRPGARRPQPRGPAGLRSTPTATPRISTSWSFHYGGSDNTTAGW